VIKTFIQTALIAVTVAVLLFATLVAAAIWLPQDQQAIRRHLVDLVASGEIKAQTHLGPNPNSLVYRHIFDCALFGMMLAPGTGAEAMRNNLATAAPSATDDPRAPPYPDCQIFLRAMPEVGGTGVAFRQYDRYILGMRVLGRALLSALPAQALPHILLGVSYGLLGLIGITAGWMLLRSRNPSDVQRAAGCLAIAVCFALFYSAHYFDAMLIFAPMDWTQFLFVLLGLVCPLGRMTPAQLAVFAASYGSLIAIFESMTGGIPLALALLPLLLALGSQDGTSTYSGKLALLWGVFCIAVVATFALKQIYAIVLLADTDNFIAALLHRTYGDLDASENARYSAIYLITTYYRASWLVGLGSSRIGAILVAGSFAVIAVAAWKRRPALTQLRRASWLSLLVLAAWVVVFLNHTILHAFFMARLLIIPIVAATVLVATEAVLRARASA
jgi:hypothetical protein